MATFQGVISLENCKFVTTISCVVHSQFLDLLFLPLCKVRLGFALLENIFLKIKFEKVLEEL